MILTRQDLHDLLTDLERDKRRQSPATITLRRKLAELQVLMDPCRLAEIEVHLKHPARAARS